MAGHSIYGFSGSDIYFNCPASVRMSRDMPNKSSEASERGTAVHSIGETCIAVGIDPKHYLGLEINGFTVDQFMVNGATLYKSVVDNLTAKYGVAPLLEQRVVMSSLGRLDVYGTSDCTHIVQSQRILHTADYKNGRVHVDVNQNTQTIGYSISTLDTFNLWDKVDVIRNTIIQPNYDHVDGPVRTVEYTIDEMRQWQKKYAITIQRVDDPNEKPIAGEHCHYCKAQAYCRARMEYVLKHAYAEKPTEELNEFELEQIYSEIGSIQRYLSEISDRMLVEGRNGANFKRFKLVDSISRAIVADPAALIAEVKSLGIDATRLYLDPKMVGKTRALEFLPKSLVNKYYRVPPASTTIVPMEDKRPAKRVGKATGVFQPIEQPRKSAAGVFEPIK